MALQLRKAGNKLFHPTLNLIRNRSRVSSVPSLFWDPFRRQSLVQDFWNTPDPFEWALPSRLTALRSPSPYWEGEKYLSNPDDGFEVALNVQNFKPEEVTVQVADNNVIIEAKHDERNEDGSYISRHFSRRFTLPDNCSIKDIVSTLSADGILTVRAPPKEIDKNNARKIHIQHTGATHVEPETAKKEDGTNSCEEEKNEKSKS